MKRAHHNPPVPVVAAITFLLLCAIAGCTTVPREIRDIRTLKQDATEYLAPSTSRIPLISPAAQAEINDDYDRIYFSPWHLTEPRYGREDVERQFSKLRRKTGYGENRRARPQSWFDALYADANIDSFPNADLPAITITNLDLRLLPTLKPLFRDFSLPGEGYPFDYLQNARVPANAPIRITHISRDKDWYFVDSPIAMGWVPSRDLALADKTFRTRWEQGSYCIAVRDHVPIYDRSGTFLFRVSIGAQFPVAHRGDSGQYRILVATRGESGEAITRQALVSKEDFVTKPVTANAANVAGLINGMIGQPYGWGGMYGNRDCSAAMKDLFAPFGLWLPRNSRHQANDGGRPIDLAGLSRTEKERLILEKGIPFATLIWRPGHIMLYVGSYRGRPVVFHNIWGLLTRSWSGKEGRRIIGHSVITTLSPGTELRGIRETRDLLGTAARMTILF